MAVITLPAQAAPPTRANVARSDGTPGLNLVRNLAPKSATSTPANWGTYHYDLARSGYDSQQPAFGSVVPGWATPTTVDGAVYAEPLVVGSTVIVATENNSVYALGLGTGSVLWRTNLGPPVPNASLPCGNVDPVGITGTPAIDQAAGMVYVVGLVQPAGQAMAYQLAAINLANGNVAYQVPITVTGLDPQHHGQRAALTLSAGTLYIPFGGRWGDCTPYHGWLVAAPANTGGPFSSFQTSVNSGGGLWQPAGASVDAAGNLYVTSGNTFCTSPCAYDGGETVFKLSTSLQTLDYFAPTNWSYLNSQDNDLGATNPLLLDAGLLLQVGKDGDGFLLNQGNLGHVGGQAFTAHVCPGLTYDAAYGGDAYVFPYIYVPCRDRLVALKLDTTVPSFAFAWQGPTVSWSGPPIVAGGLVWTFDPAGTLYALNPSTGSTAFSTNLGAGVHFATPAAGGGAVFVAAGSKVFSFIAAPPVATYSVANTPTTWVNTQSQTYPVTVTNAGSLPWPAAGSAPIHLGVHFANAGGGYGNNTWYTDQRFSLPADLAPGASVVLTISVTAPSAQNGSLVLEYQMVKESQFWFGQFSDLGAGVTSAWPAAYNVANTPANWVNTQTQTYPVTVTNTGTLPWPAAGSAPVHLGVHFANAGGGYGNNTWSTDQRFSLPADLAPGASVALTISVTAPSAQSGSLVLEYQMVKESQFWFGQFSDLGVGVTPPAAYNVANTPTTWVNTQNQTYPVTVTNTGSLPWPAAGSAPIHLGVHFANAGGGYGNNTWYTDQRFSLPTDLAPGASVVLTISVTAPSAQNGSLVLEYQMVKESQFWFGQFSDLGAGVTPAWPAAYNVANSPTGWARGQTQTYSVTVTNTGTLPWPAAGGTPVHLGVHFANAGGGYGNNTWSTDQRFSLPADLAPGASVVLTISVTAPSAQSGSLVLEYQMVKESQFWFGQFTDLLTLVS